MSVFAASVAVGVSAELVAGFAETRIATGLNPTTMTFSPDGRLFLCEKQGLLRVVVDGRMRAEPSLDLRDKIDSWNERGLLSVCFDPEFEDNGWMYVFYTYNKDPSDGSRQSSNNRVSRFTLKGNQADAKSERVLLEIDTLSKSGWHNGGGLAFGIDGKLYISTGENGKGPNAQSGENLLGKLLRINRDGTIPQDNAYYSLYAGRNRAIAAMGLRNPYTIARQEKSGLLYISVTGSRYELIVPYDSSAPPETVNCGWPDVDGPLHEKALPGDFRAPDYAYDHGEGRGKALCGGEFYEPSQPGAGAFPERYRDRFFFTDYGGWIASIDPEKPSQREEFATGINRPIDLAIAPDGALWYIERAGIPGGSDEANSASEDGSLWRVSWTGGIENALTAGASESGQGSTAIAGLRLPRRLGESFPPTLLATGVFADSELRTASSLIPYSLNSPAWADGAEVKRWVALPEAGKVGFAESGGFAWPAGTVFVQHFEMVLDARENTRRRLETRLLILDETGKFGYGAAYRWRADGSDADWVDAAGEEEVLSILDTAGEERRQTWSYLGGGLCYMCHTPNAGFVLGPKAHQLNGVHSPAAGRPENQLMVWSRRGIFSEALDEEAVGRFGQSCGIGDETASLERRVKSYLDVNCASCHRPDGSGAQWDARFETPLKDQGILGGLARNTFGVEEARIVTPGDVSRSLLHARMAATAVIERMPPLTRNVVDEEALEVIRAWILEGAER